MRIAITILVVICGCAVAFLSVFFVAICGERRQKRRCEVNRIDSNQPAFTSRSVRHHAGREWLIYGSVAGTNRND